MHSRLPLTVRLGILASLAAALQLGPLWWPGAGYLLAMAAPLPIAVGAALSPRRSNWFLAVTAIVIAMLSLEEFLIFATTNGPLGLVTGLTYGRRPGSAIAWAGLLLAMGMLLLPLLGVYPWGGLERRLGPGGILVAYPTFALAYAALWRWLFDPIWRRVRRAVTSALPPER